jgi:hypothetical protein
MRRLAHQPPKQDPVFPKRFIHTKDLMPFFHRLSFVAA